MKRICVIGNAGGGKSTLARRLAAARALPYFEVDAFLWRPDWSAFSDDEYLASHEAIVTRDAWVLDGFGNWESVARRFDRADTVILIDLPLWIHFWLAAERQLQWSKGDARHKPAGHPDPPPTKELFEMIWTIDSDHMPRLREMVEVVESAGTTVVRLRSLDEVSRYPGDGKT